MATLSTESAWFQEKCLNTSAATVIVISIWPEHTLHVATLEENLSLSTEVHIGRSEWLLSALTIPGFKRSACCLSAEVDMINRIACCWPELSLL